MQRGEKGIKAIVLYPMNALAADQARRMAAAVHADDRLRGRLRIGMFVGGKGRSREMGSAQVIDDNDHLRKSPPDILLTNYRMLDLLLRRPRDAARRRALGAEPPRAASGTSCSSSQGRSSTSRSYRTGWWGRPGSRWRTCSPTSRRWVITVSRGSQAMYREATWVYREATSMYREPCQVYREATWVYREATWVYREASHRAGFLGGRTYRFSLRTALYAVVPEEGAPLSALGPAMRAVWPKRLAEGKWDPEVAFVGAFLPADLEFLESHGAWDAALADHEARKRAAEAQGEAYAEPFPTPPAALVDAVTERLRWEATRELGVATRIGGTLEQSGCLSVSLDEARPEKLGVLHGVGRSALGALIAGLCTRLRIRGGILDPLLAPYVERSGDGFQLSKERSPLLSPFGQFTAKSIFLTSEPKPRRFDSVQPERKTWILDWMSRTTGIELDVAAARDVSMAVIPILVEAGLLGEVQAGPKHRVWGLRPDALHVSRRHTWRRCSACGYEVASTPGSASDLDGAPCLRFRCEGRFQPAPPETSRIATYYRRYYARGALGRVWCRPRTSAMRSPMCAPCASTAGCRWGGGSGGSSGRSSRPTARSWPMWGCRSGWRSCAARRSASRPKRRRHGTARCWWTRRRISRWRRCGSSAPSRGRSTRTICSWSATRTSASTAARWRSGPQGSTCAGGARRSCG